jgi:hypothetical protein
MSWQVRICEDESLMVALYVRDVAGLRPRTVPELPSLQPAVPVQGLPEGTDVERAGDQWGQWWAQRSLETTSQLPESEPPDFAALDAWPDLRALVRKHFQAAVRWSSGVRHQLIDQRAPRLRHGGDFLRADRIVEREEARLGRTATPFTFTVTELPLQGKRGWPISSQEAIVTFDLMADISAAEAFLTPLITALV